MSPAVIAPTDIFSTGRRPIFQPHSIKYLAAQAARSLGNIAGSNADADPAGCLGIACDLTTVLALLKSPSHSARSPSVVGRPMRMLAMEKVTG